MYYSVSFYSFFDTTKESLADHELSIYVDSTKSERGLIDILDCLTTYWIDDDSTRRTKCKIEYKLQKFSRKEG